MSEDYGAHDVNFDHAIIVCTRLLPADKKPNPSDACSRSTLRSGREVIEHVWGSEAAGDTPCVCGKIKYHEVSN